MKTGLKRPCDKCPFRHDIRGYLTAGRAEEIVDELLHDHSFSCHATTSYRDAEDGSTESFVTDDSEHCAGAMILLEKLQQPNQWMRWMERLGFYDRTKLDMCAPVFDTPDEFVAAQER